MIKLILTPKTQPISYIFNKDRVTIGRAAAEHVQPDLPLPLEDVQPDHVRIEELDGCFIIFNHANDPLTTLNGKPFRKKLLQNGDQIEIHSISISFLGESLESESGGNRSAEENVSDFEEDGTSPAELINLLAEIQTTALKETSDHKKAVPPKVNSLPETDIDALLKQVEELELAFNKSEKIAVQQAVSTAKPAVQQAAPSVSIVQKNAPSITARHQSLKDDYLRHLDDDHEGDKDKSAHNRVILSWKSVTTLFGGILLFICAAFAIFYISLIERSEKEEIKVAAAVADVVMALNFAQINRALPQNQNWSDPDFLKHNLTAVLATGYTPLANVDTHGQFMGTSYILRIYTSSDLSHFLVIAQPNANLLQWLSAKNVILVDSQHMELRKINDLRALNRLLVDPTLDSSNSQEISTLVSQGELIPLEMLSELQKDTGFSSPKALAFLRPGAENYIYNALRYYHFGEFLAKKAVDFYENQENEHDVGLLMQEIDILMKLKNIVLYTTGGLQSAVAAQKALATFVPQHKFLFGYLQLTQRGQALGSHLLIDDSSTEVADLYDFKTRQQNIVKQRNPLFICAKNAFSKAHGTYAASLPVQFRNYSSATDLGHIIAESIVNKPVSESQNEVPEVSLGNYLEAINRAKNLEELGKATTSAATVLKNEHKLDADRIHDFKIKFHAEVVDKLDQFLLSPKRSLQAAKVDKVKRPDMIQILKNAPLEDTEEYEYYLSEFDLLSPAEKHTPETI